MRYSGFQWHKISYESGYAAELLLSPDYISAVVSYSTANSLCSVSLIYLV
jgi:hypothetical protein